ncbi:MAG: polyhydroxyalkanoate depolymerase [Devosiaceae bacterium]|nr:polyhydroxyalkanoate depolymerase [Devosiaceae bacterium MH13]
MPAYTLYEWTHAALAPARATADMTKLAFSNPLNPFAATPLGKQIAAGAEVFERVTRRYGKPSFDIPTTLVGGTRCAVTEEVVWERPFCKLVHFNRDLPPERPYTDPKVLLVAPMSGHYATLLRGTVEAFLPRHDVYITDWVDARDVPLAQGNFDLDDYIEYIISMLQRLGPDTHIVAVCQPGVPVLAAVSLMEEDDDPAIPTTMTLMGAPIDSRIQPTEVNMFADGKELGWFRRNLIKLMPFPNAGFMRPVYPGFLQLSGFMGMNLNRHIDAHKEFFTHLVDGDGDGADKHREFYDEYLAVMDLTSEFYLQTIETVFLNHALPTGTMMHHDRPVRPEAIKRCAVLTIEGEKDDITGRGQTKAALDLCSCLSDDLKAHYEQPRVGHYGVFNGSRFRAEIQPRMTDFMLSMEWRKKGGKGKKPARAKPAQVTSANPASADNDDAAPTVDPFGLASNGQQADDLKQIDGIGPKIERMLNERGIFQFWQLAALKKAEIETLEQSLSFKGRVAREGWIGQAKKLAKALVGANEKVS